MSADAILGYKLCGAFPYTQTECLNRPVRFAGNSDICNIIGDYMAHLSLVRLGKYGEQEAHALAQSELVLGFKVGDLSNFHDRDAILSKIAEAFPDDKPKTQLNFAAQLNQFCNVMQVGDIVVVPLKTAPQIAVGRIAGVYTNSPEGRPARPVRWLKPDLPRDLFRQDLLYSFGAFMTVCEVRRNDALHRVEAILKTGRDPGYEGERQLPTSTAADITEQIADEREVDLSELCRDQIERRIASAFTGHQLTRLVAEILKAQGYVVNVSPPGADRGVDIVAGRGALGFESPRLVVQVKSGNVTADQPTLQALIGAVQDTHADHGLLVCWGGFKQTVNARKNDLFFRIRLWGRPEIINSLLQVYDRLPEELQAELPLRQVWMLVPDEDVVAQ
jgi:restriction system protein